MEYFESHAHYDDRRFREDREELLKELLPASGVSHIINIGCDVKSSEMSVRMADKYDYIYAAVGVHPHELYDMSSQTIEKLRKLSEHKKVASFSHTDFIALPPDLNKISICCRNRRYTLTCVLFYISFTNLSIFYRLFTQYRIQ